MQAYDLLSLPVWVFSVKTLKILASNRAAQAWLGYDARTLQAMTIADLRPEQDRAAIAEQVRQFDIGMADAGTWTIEASSGDRFTVAFDWKKVRFDGDAAIVASIRDSTQVVQAQERAESLSAEVRTLRHKVDLSSEHLALLCNALPGNLAVLTPGDYQIVAATNEYAQAVARERGELLGRRLLEVFPNDPDDPEADPVSNLRASLQRVEALRVSDVMSLQRHPVQGRDGLFHERFWLQRNKPVFDAAGRLIYIIHRAEDLTAIMSPETAPAADTADHEAAAAEHMLHAAETHAALLALREREARLRTAETLLDLGAWEYDLEGRTLSWSKRVFDIFGLQPDQPPPDFDGYLAVVHPDDQPQLRAGLRDFVNSGAATIDFEHRINRPDGTVAHVRGVGTWHVVEGRRIVIGHVQDITRFRAAEEQVRLASRRRRLAGRMTRLGSWHVELGAERATWCDETAAIHDEPRGKSPTLDETIAYYIPAHRQRIRAKFDACAQDGHAFDELLQIVTAKGRRVWVRAVGEAVRDPSGQIIAVEGAVQDVTELVETRHATRAVSERLLQTLESISDACFLLDDSWRFVFLNKKAELLLRRRRTDLLGRNVWAEFPDSVGTAFQIEYERAVAKGQAARFQAFYPPLDTWFEVNAYPTPEGLAVYFRDVTRQRARDEQLRLLENAVSRQNDILLITEAAPIDAPDGPRIVYVNDAFERRTGYSREDVIGKTPRILQGPKTQRAALDRIRRAMENWQPVRAELINYTSAGEEFWLEMDLVPLADDTGAFTHWVAVERDITDRRHAEEEIRLSQERFQRVTQATNEVIWDWDVIADKHWWNANLKTLTGLDPAEIEQGIASWKNRLHPEDRDEAVAGVDALIAGTETVWSGEYRFRHADGHYLTVLDRSFVIRDSEGRAVRLLGSMIDVTTLREMESRLRQSQKLESVGQLTGGVAHDFNNLLTIILGNIEFLQDAIDANDPLRRHVDMTVRAAERAAELTNRLLAFSRKQPLQPQVIDANALIGGMEDMLRRTLGEELNIALSLDARLWRSEIDPGQLESALLNLVINSRDSMPDGGSLTIETANVLLDDTYVAYEPDLTAGQYVVIAVSDTGHGIPSDQIDRAFEPFFTTKGADKGTGLGLSMVYGFVKQSGGHIRLYSEPGEGTTVKLYFPRVQGETTPSEGAEGGQSEAETGNATILVVEDDPLLLQQVCAQLADMGYTVLSADAGAAALEILRGRPDIDLLFTDVVLPGGMNGRQVADAAQAIKPGLKVLYTSGYSENAIVHHGRLDPGVDLLSKPYRRSSLAAKLRMILTPV
ncbi:PAS domain-containing hybrid sensor histidine kinase/response regulator [Rhabdonatronobacter sediminivivens]|nr:PAS domain S-box protein [Rhabdonatronobacter sediminivivens]